MLSKGIRKVVVASIASVLVSSLALTGCAAKPHETQISTLEELESFFSQYPSDKYTYAALTPAGEPQVIEADTDANGDRKWQQTDLPTVARASSTATKITIIETSVQLQLFLGFYGNGAGFSIESSPINVLDTLALENYGADEPAYIAIHPTNQAGIWPSYKSGDASAIGYAYVTPEAFAAYRADILRDK